MLEQTNVISRDLALVAERLDKDPRTSTQGGQEEVERTWRTAFAAGPDRLIGLNVLPIDQGAYLFTTVEGDF
jgi:hypothetical protein